MGLMSGWTFNITGLELPERVFGARVTGSLFPTLGTPPLLGRGIEPADDQPGGDEVVVLGYRVWQRLFAGDRGIVGRPVMMEGRPHIVIGVMPPRFRFPMDDMELWAAIKDNMTGMPRNSRFMNVVGRLKRGASSRRRRLKWTRSAHSSRRRIRKRTKAGAFGWRAPTTRWSATRSRR